MNKGYWIVRVDIINKDSFLSYVNNNSEALKKYNAKYIVRAGEHETVEGRTRSRNTILEFPSYEAALKCWNSPEYQKVKSLREGAAEIDIVIIEGYDGAQPD